MYSEEATKFCEISTVDLTVTKGQMKPKADWRPLDSPKKRRNKFDLFAMKNKKEKKNKFVRLFFWEKLADHKLLMRLTDLYLGQIYGGDFAKFCGPLRIYELNNASISTGSLSISFFRFSWQLSFPLVLL